MAVAQAGRSYLKKPRLRWVAAQNQPRREGRDLPKTIAATSKFVTGGFSEHPSDVNHWEIESCLGISDKRAKDSGQGIPTLRRKWAQ